MDLFDSIVKGVLDVDSREPNDSTTLQEENKRSSNDIPIDTHGTMNILLEE